MSTFDTTDAVRIRMAIHLDPRLQGRSEQEIEEWFGFYGPTLRRFFDRVQDVLGEPLDRLAFTPWSYARARSLFLRLWADYLREERWGHREAPVVIQECRQAIQELAGVSREALVDEVFIDSLRPLVPALEARLRSGPVRFIDVLVMQPVLFMYMNVKPVA